VTEPLHEIAHISHAELLTPKADESLRFFVEVMGMEIEATEGPSVFLRGWGDYQRYCLKLTESELPVLDRPLRFIVTRGARGAARASTLEELQEELERPFTAQELAEIDRAEDERRRERHDRRREKHAKRTPSKFEQHRRGGGKRRRRR